MSLYSNKRVILSALSVVVAFVGTTISAQAQNYKTRKEVYYDFTGVVPAWKPKNPRTTVGYWFPHMRTNTVQYNYTDNRRVDNSCNPCGLPVIRKGSAETQRLTVIEADIVDFERQRPLPYRRY